MNTNITVNAEEVKVKLDAAARIIDDHEGLKDRPDADLCYMRGFYAALQALGIDCAKVDGATRCFASWMIED